MVSLAVASLGCGATDASAPSPDVPPSVDLPPSVDDAHDSGDAAAAAPDAPSCGACAPGLECVGGACGGVVLGLQDPPTLTAGYGDEQIGARIHDSCLPGQVLTGLHLQYRDSIVRLGGTCSKVAVADRRVVLESGNPTTLRGQQGGTAAAIDCPPGTVVVGFEGRAGLRGYQLSLRCAPVTVVGDGPLSVAVGASTIVGPVGGTGGGERPGVTCPSGQVAASLQVQAVDTIYAMRLGCRPLRAFAIVRGAPVDGPIRGNADGGAPFRDVCPDGQLLAGVAVRTERYLVGVTVRCREVTGLDVYGPWPLTTQSGAVLTERGRGLGTFNNVDCVRNAAVTGFSGRAGLGIDGLQFTCAAPSVTTAGGLELTPAADTMYAGGTGGSAFALAPCPAGSTAIGANFRTGTLIDAFGLICAPLSAR